VPEAAEADFAAEPPGAWLLHHVPWTEAENRISAVGAEAEVARLLALDEGAALLAVERRTWRAGEPVTWVRQLFPGEAYDLVARFGPAR
jgi:GntR family histidine utilization transcriptional repressor